MKKDKVYYLLKSTWNSEISEHFLGGGGDLQDIIVIYLPFFQIIAYFLDVCKHPKIKSGFL